MKLQATGAYLSHVNLHIFAKMAPFSRRPRVQATHVYMLFFLDGPESDRDES